MNQLLAALAGLPPMPRTPLTINPCPPGYSLQVAGGKLVCMLETAQDGDENLMMRNRVAAMQQAQQENDSDRPPLPPDMGGP